MSAPLNLKDIERRVPPFNYDGDNVRPLLRALRESRTALKHFADVAGYWDMSGPDTQIIVHASDSSNPSARVSTTVGDLRLARAVLEGVRDD